MNNGINLTGFEDFYEAIDDMEITPERQIVAMKKALNIYKRSVSSFAPETTGKTKKSIRTKVKNMDFGCEGMVAVYDWAAQFQEFRNTMQTGKYIGWFERAVNSAEGEATSVIRKELLK